MVLLTLRLGNRFYLRLGYLLIMLFGWGKYSQCHSFRKGIWLAWSTILMRLLKSWLTTTRDLENLCCSSYMGLTLIAIISQNQPSLRFDNSAPLSECRVFKSNLELTLIQFANDISSGAHVEVMRKTKAGMKEYQLESMFLHHTYIAVLHYGHAAAPNDRVSFSSFVLNACLRRCCLTWELNTVSTDLTLHAHSLFTKNLNAVLDAHNAVITTMKPGVSWVDIHKLAEKIILESLKKGNILVGNIDDLMVERLGAIFMPHGLGHILGIDTHDPGVERPKQPGLKSLRTARQLLEVMVKTVEPGCYFIDALLVPAMENANT
ncbi:hypothetical protein CRYUN_Cryun02cG0015300 [Craigia yunnanensis]